MDADSCRVEADGGASRQVFLVPRSLMCLSTGDHDGCRIWGHRGLVEAFFSNRWRVTSTDKKRNMGQARSIGGRRKGNKACSQRTRPSSSYQGSRVTTGMGRDVGRQHRRWTIGSATSRRKAEPTSGSCRDAGGCGRLRHAAGVRSQIWRDRFRERGLHLRA